MADLLSSLLLVLDLIVEVVTHKNLFVSPTISDIHGYFLSVFFSKPSILKKNSTVYASALV